MGDGQPGDHEVHAAAEHDPAADLPRPDNAEVRFKTGRLSA